MTEPLPPLEPRRRAEGLPELAPRGAKAEGLPGIESGPARSGGGLPPIASRPEGAASTPPPPPPPGAPRRRHLRVVPKSAALVAVAIVAAGAAGGLTAWALDDDPVLPATAQTGTTSAPVTPTVSSEEDLADAVARVSPTVVQVRTDAGQGSGVIIEPSGLIVTNEHVIQGASRVEVITQDERRIGADVVSTDSRQDLAVLRPDQDPGRGAELVDAPDGGLRQGDRVFAIGSPFGLQNTVTAGVVSAVNRTNPEGVPMIQIDAPINPGNSGGGLFDLEGRLVGIPTSILGPIQGNVGIGFAVPASRVRTLLDGAP
ncbi:MAG: S1C family serine protease [Thermoleophilia bacterium]